MEDYSKLSNEEVKLHYQKTKDSAVGRGAGISKTRTESNIEEGLKRREEK